MINISYYILIFLSLLDFFTTKAIVDIIGYSAEANPIILHIMIYFDTVWSLLVVKFIFLTAFGYLIPKLQSIKDRTITDNILISILISLNIVYGLVVIRSFYIIGVL